MKDILECYKILDLHPGASPERVRRSYLELAAVWNPEKHLDNPPLRSKMEKKRMEIDEAYVTLKQFMPELRHDYVPNVPEVEQTRDFNELSQRPTKDVARIMMVVLFGGVLALIFWFAYDLLQKTRSMPKAGAVVVDPEASGGVYADSSTAKSPADGQ